MRAARALAVATVFASVIGAPAASALPTMIRLGYADCASCHLSPQGGGPLNGYGRGIDQAQSLRGGEYEPRTSAQSRALTVGGRMTQDLRTVIQQQASWTSGRPGSTLLRPRLLYRNVTAITDVLRVAATITAESRSAPQPALSYDPAGRPSSLFVNTALLHYRASRTIELAAGRDQLPSGVNLPDPGLFITSRNRLGPYDAPTQVKMFWHARRVRLTPFGYTGGGESGGGTLVEVDLSGQQKTVAGVTLRRGTATSGHRQTMGAYARLGFGAWGVLAEHDVTDRTQAGPAAASFQQSATFAQAFWAVREWLVASAIGERLRVAPPFEEHLTAGKLEVVARLSSHATMGVNARLQKDVMTGRHDRSLALHVALKTVP